MSDYPKKMNKPGQRSIRPSISVSGKIYERLRTAFPYESLSVLVDDMIVSALDDPMVCARVVALCQGLDELS